MVDDLLLQEIQSLKEQLRIAISIIKQYAPEFDEGDFIHDLGTEDYGTYIENEEHLTTAST